MMRRAASLLAMAIVLASCGGGASPAGTTSPAELPGGDEPPEWSLVEVGALEGAVDVVERSEDDRVRHNVAKWRKGWRPWHPWKNGYRPFKNDWLKRRFPDGSV